MPTVIPVKFKYAARELWFDPNETGAEEGDHVICSTERGEEIGLATMDAVEMDDERLHETIGDAILKPVLRVATDEDLDRAEELAELGEQAFPTFRKLVGEAELEMKPVGVEYLFGGGKAVCYFSAEERVDFRQLVRDLSRELHERIDMRQIGVREEAAIVGGFAHCGQELCCARFGRQFEPVTIRMAKEQDLPLNSSKISGACGRLMCCLRYEFEAYRDFKTRAPKRNAVIDTPLGKGKIVEYDTPKEQICLRLENGKQVRVALADMVASEAAHKKSEELGCPCRPDTVTRAALDKIDSPEVKMALAELDRQMGIIPEEPADDSVLFVETKPRRRRRKTTIEEAPQQQDTQQQQQRQEQSKPQPEVVTQEASSNRSRRRRRKAQSQDTTAVQQQAPQQPAPEVRRQPAADAQPTTRRRRRHHAAVADESSPAQQTPKQQQQPAQQAQKQQPAAQSERPRGMQPKRRRRPGDKAGLAAQEGQQGQQAHKKPAPKHKAPAPNKAQRQPKDATAQGDAAAEAKPKRRRRHRGGRGRGKGGQGDGSGNPASSSE